MPRTSTVKKTRGRSRTQLKRALEGAIRAVFPTDTVDISDGYGDNIHVMVVSRKFDGLSESEKQDLVWDIIDSVKLSKVERGLISLVYPVSPAEIK